MLKEELARLEADGTPIRLGVSGAGWMGGGFLAQVAQVPGMDVTVLADADTESAWEAFVARGVARENIVEADAPGPAVDALRAGKRVVTGSYALAASWTMWISWWM